MKNEGEIILAVLVVAGALYYYTTYRSDKKISQNTDVDCGRERAYDIETRSCVPECGEGTVTVAHPETGDLGCLTLNTDLNQDGMITTADLLIFLGAFGTQVGEYTNNQLADYDQDGYITTQDLLTILANFGYAVKKQPDGGILLTGGFINAV